MSLPEKILHHIKQLPESKQIEVLDFIEYLENKLDTQEEKSWSELSLASAMKEMEDEASPYSDTDIDEKFL